MQLLKEKYPSVSSVIMPEMERLCTYVCGKYLLQLEAPWLSSPKIGKRFNDIHLTEKQVKHHLSHVYSLYEALPFSNESIDIIASPHLPHYEINYHTIVKELLRVLKPNGYLCILGISIMSLQAAENRISAFKRLKSFYALVKSIKFLEGALVHQGYYFDYPVHPPLSLYQQYQRCKGWLLPSDHHYYFIVAQKQVKSIQVIPLEQSFTLFPMIKKATYVKS